MTDTTNSSSDYVHCHIAKELPAMTRFAKRLAGSDHEDLVQETIVRALNASGQFRPGTALKSWLFTIMRNAFCTRYKRGQRESIGLDDGQISRQSISAPQEWAIRSAELRRAICGLNAESRRTLLLVAFGTSYDDTARICGCEVGTVKSRVSRARQQLSLGLDA